MDRPEDFGYKKDAKLPMNPGGWRKPNGFRGSDGQLMSQIPLNEPDSYSFNGRFGKPAEEKREKEAEPELDVSQYEKITNIYADFGKYALQDMALPVKTDPFDFY